MKIIPLTQGKLAIVDDEDYDLLSQWKWHYNKGYATRNIWCRPGFKTIKMHAVIASTPKGMHTDHINGNTLDNRRENLRVCLPSENVRNSKMHINNKSGKRGVHFDASSKKWKAQISVDGKKIHLGLFDDIDMASNAYDTAAMAYHGEYARTNERYGEK